MTTQPITPALFDFLRDLKANNERPWFEANKARYRAEVRDPMLDFIAAFGEPLAAISPPLPRRSAGQRRLAVPHLPRYPLLEEQDALQDQCRRPFPSHRRQGCPCARLLSPPGGRRLFRRLRCLAPRRPDPGRHPRCHCRPAGRMATHYDGRSLPRHVRTDRRVPQTAAARLRSRSPADRRSQTQILRCRHPFPGSRSLPGRFPRSLRRNRPDRLPLHCLPGPRRRGAVLGRGPGDRKFPAQISGIIFEH